MADMPPKIAYGQVLDKYDWAEKHIHKLDAALRELREANPIFTSTKTNPETGEVTYYVEQVPAIPSSIPLITGDVLHSLRGALDYLACGLIEDVTPDAKFPIAHSAEAYKASSLGRCVPGLKGKALETLNSIKPYKGGNLLLWLLHKLNNIDKHRLLLAVCVINPARAFAPDEMTAQESSGPEQIVVHTASGSDIILRGVKQPPVPLHTGKEFLILTESEAQKHVGLYFTVSINELGISDGVALNLLLGLIFNQVGIIIAKLAPFLIW